MKRNISLGIIFILFLSSVFTLSFLTSPSDKTESDVPVATSSAFSFPSFRKKEGTFRYIKNYTDIYFYDDRYFFKDPTEYDPELSTMSFALALSSFSTEETDGDTDFTNNFANVQNLLCSELGYTDFSANNMYSQEPATDSIAVAAAHKKVYDETGTPYTIIAIAVRGGGYGKEWTSNFTLGESGQAKGFCDAKDQVLTFLKEYISTYDHHIAENVKLWITGFSRGAATSNLVAGALNDTPDILGQQIKFSKKDIYAYCFATPMGALKSDIDAVGASNYSNICIVINKNDPVPYLAMSDLGFARYGNDHYFPDILTSPENYRAMEKEMTEHYKNLATFSEAGEYTIDKFNVKKINILYLTLAALDTKNTSEYTDKIIESDSQNTMTQGQFIESAISIITQNSVTTRSNYVSEFEGGIRTIFETIHGSAFTDYPAEMTSRCFVVFMNKLKDPLNIAKIIFGIFESDNSPSIIITTILTESMNECGMMVSDDKIPELERFSKAAVSLMAKFSISHPNLTATLISNLQHITSGHNHELYFAWLKTEDQNYRN